MKTRLVLFPIFLLYFFQTATGQNRHLHDRLENLKSITSDAVFFLEYKMEPTPDGGFVIANKERNSTDIHVIKFDSCGYLSWSKRLEKLYDYATCSGMLTDPAGNVALLFQRYSVVGADTAYLVKMDAGGALLWSKKIALPGDLGKADFALASNGSYCLGSIYFGTAPEHPTLLIFVDAETGEVKSTVGLYAPGGAGVPKFANLPDGNLLVRQWSQAFSINPTTLEVAWAKAYPGFYSGGDCKPLVLSSRIVDFIESSPATNQNVTPVFFDLKGNFLYRSPEISARQDTYRPFRYGPRQMTQLPGERIAFVTTDSAGGFRPALIVLDSLGKLLLTKHFHPAGTGAKRAAHDHCLLKDGTIAIVGEENDRVEVLKVSPEAISPDCTTDTISYPAPSEIFFFPASADLLFQTVPLPQFFSAQYSLNVLDFDVQVNEKCSAIDAIADRDSTLFLCPGDSAMIAADYLSPTICVWDDGFTGCQRSIRPGETRTATATVRCAVYTQQFTAVENPDCPCFVNIPNVFTPNGDHINDVFRPVGGCKFLDFNMQIFNRWGQQVFSTTEPENGWDGTNNGRPAASDLYAFLLNYRTTIPGSRPVVKKGGVTLLR